MKVLLIDQHAMLRESVYDLIVKWNPSATVEAYPTPQDLFSSVPTEECDLIVLRFEDWHPNKYSVLSRLNSAYPDARLVCLIDSLDSQSVPKLISYGAKAIVTSSSSSSEFMAIMQLVMVGGLFVPNELMFSEQNEKTSCLVDDSLCDEEKKSISQNEFMSSNYHVLSNRQKEVLRYLCEGKSNKVISSTMGLSINTIKAHLTSIFKVLNVRNRTEAVVLFSGSIAEINAYGTDPNIPSIRH